MTMRDESANPDAEHDTPLPDVPVDDAEDEHPFGLAEVYYLRRSDRHDALKYAAQIAAALLPHCSTPPNLYDPSSTRVIANNTVAIARVFEAYLNG